MPFTVIGRSMCNATTMQLYFFPFSLFETLNSETFSTEKNKRCKKIKQLQMK